MHALDGIVFDVAARVNADFCIVVTGFPLISTTTNGFITNLPVVKN
jgi:hypothetical protein